jgi:hypothetical protein
VDVIPGIAPDMEENLFTTEQLDIPDHVPRDKIDFDRKKGSPQSSASLGSSFYW